MAKSFGTHSRISPTPTLSTHLGIPHTLWVLGPSPCSGSPRESSQHFLSRWGRHCRDRCSTMTLEARPIERHQGTSRQRHRPLPLPIVCSQTLPPTMPFSPRPWRTSRAHSQFCDSCAWKKGLLEGAYAAVGPAKASTAFRSDRRVPSTLTGSLSGPESYLSSQAPDNLAANTSFWRTLHIELELGNSIGSLISARAIPSFLIQAAPSTWSCSFLS